MFGREKRPVPLDRVEVTVGPTANIHGDLVCDGIVKIDGVYRGSIKTVSNVIISEKGRVEDPRVESSTRVEFEKPALDALKRWRFKPGEKDGQPVRTYLRQPIRFRAG